MPASLDTISPAIALQAVDVERDGRTVLEHLSLDVPLGAFVVVLGPNGSGKSTLIRTILGELKPRSGTARVFSENQTALSWTAAARLRRRMALMPQLPDQVGATPLTVREVVEIGRVSRAPTQPLNDADHRACGHWLERFGLTALADRSTFSLSGGEQRKAHLARVFAQEADLLLLDEPAGHLDLSAQDMLLNLLVDAWRETHRTVLMVTHELRHIPPEATHVCMLRRGSILAYGKPGDVMTDANISALYGEPLELVLHRGRYLAFSNHAEGGRRHG